MENNDKMLSLSIKDKPNYIRESEWVIWATTSIRWKQLVNKFYEIKSCGFKGERGVCFLRKLKKKHKNSKNIRELARLCIMKAVNAKEMSLLELQFRKILPRKTKTKISWIFTKFEFHKLWAVKSWNWMNWSAEIIKQTLILEFRKLHMENE